MPIMCISFLHRKPLNIIIMLYICIHIITFLAVCRFNFANLDFKNKIVRKSLFANMRKIHGKERKKKTLIFSRPEVVWTNDIRCLLFHWSEKMKKKKWYFRNPRAKNQIFAFIHKTHEKYVFDISVQPFVVIWRVLWREMHTSLFSFLFFYQKGIIFCKMCGNYVNLFDLNVFFNGSTYNRIFFLKNH